MIKCKPFHAAEEEIGAQTDALLVHGRAPGAPPVAVLGAQASVFCVVSFCLSCW